MSLCAHKDVLGVPGKGVHSLRVGGFALVDILGSFGLAWLLHRWTGLGFGASCLLVFGLGIALHRLFCVSTTLDHMLFGRE